MIGMDVPKVRGKIVERGYDLTTFSAELGISRNTLAGYLKNPGKTPYNIVAKMADALCDDTAEATRIFFAANLRDA